MQKSTMGAAIQFHIELGQVSLNLKKAMAGLERVAEQGAQLAVLPEMWSSGYDYRHLRALANETPAVVKELCALSAARQIVVVGSLAEAVADKIYNCAYVIDCGQLVGQYHKLHLFSTMQEDRFLAAGDQALTLDTSAGRLGIAICYDLRFPELFRKLALEGAEIICLPAEWPKPRQEHWNALIRARAIENQLFVIAANCCGIQGKLDFFGQSQLVSPLGHLLAYADAEETELLADFDFSEMVQYRKQINTLGDRRADIYGTP